MNSTPDRYPMVDADGCHSLLDKGVTVLVATQMLDYHREIALLFAPDVSRTEQYDRP